MLQKLSTRLRAFFVRFRRVHLRQDRATTVEELIALMDRFLDGPMRYDLEWDDFISWENGNPHVEQIRQRIGEFEPLLFSKKGEERDAYRKKLIGERNRLAALLRLPSRV